MVIFAMVLSMATPFIVFPSSAQATTFGSAASAANDAEPLETTTLILPAPTSISSGNFLIAGIAFNGGTDTSLTAPSGWILIERTDGEGGVDTEIGIATYYKIAGSSEPSSYTWDVVNTEGGESDTATEPRAAGGIIRYTGVDTSDPIDVMGEQEGDDDILVAPSVTTTDPNETVIVFYAQDDNNDHPTPSGTTERYDVENLDVDGPQTSAADFVKTTAGSTGTKSIDIGSSTPAYVTQTIALRNTPTGSLQITKTTLGGDGTFEFTGDAGSFEITTSVGTGSITIDDLEEGSYSVTEASQTGWEETSNTCVDVIVEVDETAECTITNTKLSTITGLKFDDTNGNGQKDENEPGLPDVAVALGRVDSPQGQQIPIEIIALSLTGQDGTFTIPNVPTGNYKLFEEDKNGWVVTKPPQTSQIDSFFDITYQIETPPLLTDSFFDIFIEVPGQTIDHGTPSNCGQETCSPVSLVFGNFEKVTITVQKDVVNPQEGEASDSHTFGVKLDDGEEFNFSENSSKTYDNIGPGTYTVTETIGDPDFDLLSISNDNDEDASNGATFTVSSGQDVTITITNKQKTGNLTVKKVVQNHGIGEAVPSDFTMEVEGENVSNPSFAGNSEEGTIVTLNPGSYSVGESGPEGYAMSLSENCSGTIDSNETLTCTVTNSDIPTGQGAITVIKTVINDNGGQGEANDFTLTVTPEEDDSMEVSDGQAEFLAPGNYTVGENPNPFNYTNTSISCTNGETTTTDGSVVLAEQEAWVCTITNDDDVPSLTLVKEVTNNNGGSADESAWTLTATGPTGLSGAGPSVSSNASFDQGTYTLSESDGPAGYTASDWVCEGGSQEGDEITINLGEDAVCTITNDDQPGTIIVKKIVINDDEGENTADDFSFQVNGGEETPFIQDGENELLGEKIVSVDAETYDITEVTVAGYTTSYDNCSNVEVDNGETETCTITNNDVGDIDGDGVGDETDNCSEVSNPDQLNTDNDSMGDVCDPDDDNDGQTDADETTCGSDPLDAESESLDTDSDNIPNCADTDDDGDEVLDTTDNCPINANTNQADTDEDGIGNVCDSTPEGESVVPAKLTVIKEVINNNGKTKTATSFSLFVGTTSVVTGVQNSFTPGTYNIHETADADYSILLIDGDCATNGDITLVAGDVKTCRIVNDDVAPESTGGGGGGGPINTFILGDINKDGKVDGLDLAILFANWGASPADTNADVNKDGKVDIIDFSILMVNWTI